MQKNFKDKFGRDATIFVEAAYTAARIVEKALEAVNGNIEDSDAFVKGHGGGTGPGYTQGPGQVR